MLIAILSVLGGLVGLVLGAEGLVRGAASLALRLGVSMLAVGLTVVAFGTSAPELVVSIRASLVGQADVAVGNVIGSNIFNIAVILGIGAVIYPIECHSSVVRREIPIMLGVTLLLPLAIGIEWLINPDQGYVLARWAGILFIILAFAYSYLAYKLSSAEGPSLEAELAAPIVGVGDAEKARHRSIWVDLAYIFGGFVLLFFGGEYLLEGAVQLAHMAGLSELVIGLTVVALGTSMPELATSVVAALRKEPDISVGNVVGSSVMNILAVLGAAATISPVSLSPVVLWRDGPMALAVGFLCLPIMASRGHIDRWEGLLFLAIYSVYVAILFYT